MLAKVICACIFFLVAASTAMGAPLRADTEEVIAIDHLKKKLALVIQRLSKFEEETKAQLTKQKQLIDTLSSEKKEIEKKLKKALSKPKKKQPKLALSLTGGLLPYFPIKFDKAMIFRTALLLNTVGEREVNFSLTGGAIGITWSPMSDLSAMLNAELYYGAGDVATGAMLAIFSFGARWNVASRFFLDGLLGASLVAFKACLADEINNNTCSKEDPKLLKDVLIVLQLGFGLFTKEDSRNGPIIFRFFYANGGVVGKHISWMYGFLVQFGFDIKMMAGK